MAIKNLLVLFVAYDEYYYELSKNSLIPFLDSFEYPYTLKTITNNSDLADIEYYGSNICGEFSGWSELLESECLSDYDHVLFVNDTFWRHLSRIPAHSRYKRILHSNFKSKYLLGELQYSIDYTNLFRPCQFVLRWVRTSVFMMDFQSALRIFALLPLNSDPILRFTPTPSIVGNVPLQFQVRILKWLFPTDLALGWHSARTSSNKRLQLKAKCILAELYLTDLATQSKISIFSSIDNLPSLRLMYYELMYFVNSLIFS